MSMELYNFKIYYTALCWMFLNSSKKAHSLWNSSENCDISDD